VRSEIENVLFGEENYVEIWEFEVCPDKLLDFFVSFYSLLVLFQVVYVFRSVFRHSYIIILIAFFFFSFIFLKNRHEDSFFNPSIQIRVPYKSVAFQERFQNLRYLLTRNLFPIHFSQLFQNNITNLKWNSFTRDRLVLEKSIDCILVPLHGLFSVLFSFQVQQELVEHKPDQHQILVNSVVVHSIPVMVENVKELLEPFSLVLLVFDSTEDCSYL